MMHCILSRSLREYMIAFKIEFSEIILVSILCNPNVAFGNFPLDVNGLVKSRTRFGLLGPFVETEDQWVTFCFGCIGNCAIRNVESFSDEWSSESAPRASGTETDFLCSLCEYMRRERETL